MPTSRAARSPTASITADIITNDQISHADEYKPLIVGYHNGVAVRLSDVADVIDSTQNIRTAGYLNGNPRHGDHLPPAGREHHPDRRSHPRPAAVPQGLHPSGHRHHHRSGPHHHHPRLGP